MENIEDTKQQDALILIGKLKNQVFRNKQSRIEFANIILQLASNDHTISRKLIWKMGEFVKYWGNDEMIDEKEWRKLNNTNNNVEPVENHELGNNFKMVDEESKVKKYKSLFREYNYDEETAKTLASLLSMRVEAVSKWIKDNKIDVPNIMAKYYPKKTRELVGAIINNKKL